MISCTFITADYKKDISKLRYFLNSYCPINNGVESFMEKNTFEKMCKIHSKKKISKKGFFNMIKKDSDVTPCMECKIKDMIKNDKEYIPPKGIKFKKFENED